jgi:hypothetical protein
MTATKIAPALTVLAVGANVWGKGATIDDAVRNAMKHGGTNAASSPVVIYITDDPGIYVDDMGYITRKAGSLYQCIHATRKGWRYGQPVAA